MSMLRTINTIMSIGAKAHYMNGGNTRKAVDPKTKPQYTFDEVVGFLGVDADEFRDALVEQGFMTMGGYITDERFGQGTKFNDVFVQAFIQAENDKDAKYEPKIIWSVLFYWFTITAFVNFANMNVLYGFVCCVIVAVIAQLKPLNIYFVSKFDKRVRGNK